ncbi:unnamed protein product [Rangifer tarandus platyrhynchus]|uniref:Uncharacterized protein n=2 Tax=Rangifer tarandus platyrhynchus TaxID=3082113 RepID=A0ABN8XXC2_RANTA|nr:unnamed protein product [Rangifer tarandus platyrhynchus]
MGWWGREPGVQQLGWDLQEYLQGIKGSHPSPGEPAGPSPRSPAGSTPRFPPPAHPPPRRPGRRPESRRVRDSGGPAPTGCQVQRPWIPAEAPEAGGRLRETRPDRPVAAAGEQGAGPPPAPRSGSDTRCSPGAPYLLRAAVAAGGALSQASAARGRSTEAAAVAAAKDNQQPAGFGTAAADAGLTSGEPGPPPTPGSSRESTPWPPPAEGRSRSRRGGAKKLRPRGESTASAV